MRDFLQDLKIGMQEAQQKFALAQQKFTAAQAESNACQQRLAVAQSEYQTAAQEFQAFQTLVNRETRKEQLAAPVATVAHAAHAAPSLPAGNSTSQSAAAPQTAADDNKSEGSKTQAVRDLLRQHPTGMTPVEIWNQLQTKMSNRAYLYSVLKRLRDKGDARERRGKYFLILKPDEGQSQTVVQ